MKFIVSSSALLKQLQNLQGVICRSNTLPILDYFLFKIEGNQATITASDLETTISVKVPVEAKKPGSFVVPAKRFTKALKAFPAQHLTIEVSASSLVRITNEQGRYEIKGDPSGEYPKTSVVEGGQEMSFPASALHKGLAKTIPFTGNDDLRPVMAGVHFDLTDQAVSFVATDAHRLMIYTPDGMKIPKADGFIVASKTVRILKKYLDATSGEVKILFNAEMISFDFEGVHIVARLVSGKYPNYRSVLPKEAPNKITIDRLHFLSSVRRMHLFSNGVTHQVRLELNGSVVMKAEDLDDGSNATERLMCGYEGKVMNIGFNARFLTDILRNMNCPEVVIQMSEPNRAATIVPTSEVEDQGKTIALVMPVMLND